MYNINIEVRDIILYFKHLMCGPQQLKAKLCGFDQLDDDTCFWLIDFSQKILPIKFGGGGGGGGGFGKEGWLYILTIFIKK